MKDVIVVGGGPAGSACAIQLARLRFDVLVLDRARFPRDKPCGEFLTPEAVRILDRLGCWGSVQACGAVPIPSIAINAPNGRQAIYPGHPHTSLSPHLAGFAGWSIRRTELDTVVMDAAKAAGAQVEQGTSVRGLLRNESGAVIGVRTNSGEKHARLVIGADGTHSLIARELGLVRPIRRLQRIAIVSHWTGAHATGLEMRCRRGIACGFSPVSEDVANLTIVAPTSEAARMAGRTEPYLRETLDDLFPEVAGRLGEAQAEVRSTGCFGHYCRRASAAGVMLVGDAAAFTDPFTGEGIYFALRGAELAAETAAAALTSSDLSAESLSDYDRARRELQARYRLCDLVQAVVRTPLLINRAVNAMACSSPLQSKLMRVLGDEDPPRNILNPAFAWSLFSPIGRSSNVG